MISLIRLSLFLSFSFILLASHSSVVLLGGAQSPLYSKATASDDTIKTESQLFGCALHESSIHCDPTSNELVGNSYNGLGTYSTAYNITTDKADYVAGKSGNGLQFIARYLESVLIDGTASLNPEEFSVSFWMKRTPEEEVPYAHIVSHTTEEQDKGWVFDITETPDDDPGLRFSVFNEDGDGIFPSDVPIESGSFIHIVGTFDGTTVRIYKNGVILQEAQFAGRFNSNPETPLRIGAASFSASNLGWSGIIDEVAYFDRAISSEEITILYEKPGIGVGEDQGASLESDPDTTYRALLGYWGFEGNTYDTSGNDNHGTIPTMVTSMAFAPDGRLFFDERTTGKIRIIRNGEIISEPFAVISDYYASWEQGMLGITIDNHFEQNHFVYLFYTAVDKDTEEVFSRVVRFTDFNDRGTDEKVLLDRIPAVKGYHVGGALAFNPKDDKLYITVGDMTEHEFALDPNILIGKVLRINRDGSIPSDNPYPNSPVYTMGHRNMYGLAFDNEGYGIVTENGETLYDEINAIQKAGNYGFPLLQPANKSPELADPTKSILPLRSYWEVIAPTQAIYYDGDKIPELKGKFIFGSYVGDIYALTVDKETSRVTNEEKIDLQVYPFFPVISIAKSPDGDIYFGSFAIKKLNYLEEVGRQPHLFFVSTNIPSTTKVESMEYDQDSNRILFTLQQQPQQSLNTNDGAPEQIASGANATIKISRSLIGTVASVSDENGLAGTFRLLGEELLDGTEREYTTVTIPYDEIRSSSTIVISGSTIGSEGPDENPVPPPIRTTVGVDIVRGATAQTDKAYSPNPIEIIVGDTITFMNRDSVLHTATSGNGKTGEKSGVFDTSLLGPSRAADITFKEGGEFPYFCELHPTMVGLVKVTASSTGAGGGNDNNNGKTPDFRVSSLYNGRTYEVVGNSGTVRATELAIEPENSVVITFEGSGEVELSLPKSMIEGINSVTATNGQLIEFDNTVETDSATTISFIIEEDAGIIEIRGAKVVPEFPLISLLMLGVALSAAVILARIGVGTLNLRTRIFRGDE